MLGKNDLKGLDLPAAGESENNEVDGYVMET